MNFFIVWNARHIRRLFFLTAAVLLSAGIIWVEKENISVFAPHPPAAVYSVPTERKVVAITFDISWGEKRADPILDILKNKGVQNVTFFLSSPWSKTHPDIVKRIADSGYEIGSHGHKHVNYSQLGDDEIRNQISTAHGVLTEMTGKGPNLIRMPNGDFDKRVLRIAEGLNYKVIQWDTDSLDWKNPGVDNIVQRVVTRAHPGDIILLHASDSCKQTHEALPIIIDQLRAKGYEFVTVSQLLGQAETKGNTVQDRTTWNELPTT
ncbi:polysaccharide deacetylase family sporulation protein PdaB [Cohnella faecalis]|uniref:Polysaccharide deacetylase family sporulation protein PdaB n=1 Tax=Cohnella faecalis TaxID=2315694 RepID=A0A398CNU0_9BACL|nr:polysaccharide deacetylase family sporulation protein PdaB [Cohnella faecalis]RIE05026.1 polysaccharide deacetylase family sporulation protein PdaB [Cohnella faecalis]